MTPNVGEVFMLDLGCEGKVRPVVIMSREDPHAPRALALFVPLARQSERALTPGEPGFSVVQ
jgi:mRNA-degrading endonuclease toxin of MazEF toxin-antitoxin module